MDGRGSQPARAPFFAGGELFGLQSHHTFTSSAFRFLVFAECTRDRSRRTFKSLLADGNGSCAHTPNRERQSSKVTCHGFSDLNTSS